MSKEICETGCGWCSFCKDKDINLTDEREQNKKSRFSLLKDFMKKSLCVFVAFSIFFFLLYQISQFKKGEEHNSCHQNLTCEAGKTCYAVDKEFECFNSVRRVDARSPVCLEVSGVQSCFATLSDCLVTRGVITHVGGTAGECTKLSYPSITERK